PYYYARGRNGSRSKREPSGPQTRRDPRPLPRQISLPFLTGPLWTPPQPYRRLLAGDEGHDRRWTMFWRSSPALPAHPPGADGASRAPHLCVSLVAHSASDFAGPARDTEGARMDQLTERLVEYALALSYEDLPPEVVERTKRLILDTVGCALGAAPWQAPSC